MRKMGIQNFWNNEGVLFLDKKIAGAQSAQNSRKVQIISLRTYLDTKIGEPMVFSTKAKDWLTKHGLEGFIWVAKAPPHMKLEKVATTINTEGISKVTVQATIDLPSGGLHLIETPLQKY